MRHNQHATLRLPLRRRFHIRLALLVALGVFAVLVALSVAYYQLTVDAEIEGLRRQIRAMAVSLAAAFDGEVFEQFQSPEDMETEAYRDVAARIEKICDVYPALESIYVLLRTEEPATLVFAIDHWLPDPLEPPVEDPPRPGTRYDASQLPEMLRGLEVPTVEAVPRQDQWGFSLSGYAPLVSRDGRKVGVVGVDLSTHRIEAVRHEALRISAAVSGGAALLLVLLAGFVGRSVRRPLGEVIGASVEIAQGHFSTRLPVDRRDEFGVLSENFNHMADGLEQREFIRDTFGRFVSQDVAQALLAAPDAVKLGGERREVTVLLSDLRSYSTISQHLAPDQVVDMLNAYFGAMNEVIDRHQGCVIEYLGDGILVVFGAPNQLPDHAACAVRCALEMGDRLAALNREWERNGLAELWKSQGVPELKSRIGVHSGTVVAGNLGSPKRMKYCVTGDTVNVAARLEALNKVLSTEVLISEPVHRLLPDSLAANTVDRGEHLLKGRDEPTHVYSAHLSPQS
jgi:adenylate cyclase